MGKLKKILLFMAGVALAAFAQEESHSISENTRRGFKQRFQMGIAKYTKTFGYVADKDDTPHRQ